MIRIVVSSPVFLQRERVFLLPCCSVSLAMASGGQPPSPSLLSKTWADVAAAAQRKPSSPLVEGPVLRKLKSNTSKFIRVDHDTLSRVRMRFQMALYGKFFGKSPSFEQVKVILSEKWADIGIFHISDLPNGYL